MAKSIRPKLEGAGAIQRAVTAMAAAAQDPNVRLVVGYEAPYAIYVHERLDVFHATGQAKFLEQPAREMAFQLGRMVYDELRNAARNRKGLVYKALIKAALLKAGHALLAASQPLVPVDTGYLRSSGFVKVERTSGGE